MKWNYDGTFFDQFSPAYRGTIGDRFCREIRSGRDDPRAVLEAVRQYAEQRDGEWLKVAHALTAGEGWDVAQHFLDRESLPMEDQHRLKRESRLEYLQGRDLPSTVDYQDLPF